MTLSPLFDQTVFTRRVASCTRCHQHRPATRLMSRSDLGELLRPFVFLDLVDISGAAQRGFGLYPHSGIATITRIPEGSFGYEDMLRRKGNISPDGLEWIRAGGGAWHRGDFGDSNCVYGFQLSIALPPEVELGQAESIYLEPDVIENDGPATVPLDLYGARSPIQAPFPIDNLSVKLRARDRRRCQSPEWHTVGWAAASLGRLSVPNGLHVEDLAVFEESHDAIEFHAETDTAFVPGSTVKHPHDLVLGYCSVHASDAALQEGEAPTQQIGMRLSAGA
jgi:redox-sensitive bicupin YhaK (pirin superfamily)